MAPEPMYRTPPRLEQRVYIPPHVRADGREFPGGQRRITDIEYYERADGRLLPWVRVEGNPDTLYFWRTVARRQGK